MKISKEKRENNERKKLILHANNLGITLIALVITIIVLLILAGVSLSMIFSQDGIFSRAEQATDKYGQAKARETLEIAFSDLQMEKYEKRLSLEDLDNRITEEINKMGGEEIGDDKTEVIVDGYRFTIDRTLPKIVEELGAADGVIISANVSGNKGWFKGDETINITVTGIIKTYSGGTIINVSATKGGEPITGFSINAEGRYTINNITSATEIIITAEDSNRKSNTRKIPIIIKTDDVSPVIDLINAKVDGLKIKFTATAHDNESGLESLNYSISSTQDTALDGIPTDRKAGTITIGQEVEITTNPTGNREKTTYNITITAIDKAKNTTSDTKDVTTICELTIEQAKTLVNENTLKKYLGVRIKDYNPLADSTGVYRIFYYDKDGYFGYKNKIYLKRDYDENLKTALDINSVTVKGTEMMQKMNPKWRDYPTENANILDFEREKATAKLCDPDSWNDYLDQEKGEFSIGGAPIEMMILSMKSYSDNKIFNIDTLNVSSTGYMSGSGATFIDLTSTGVSGGAFGMFFVPKTLRILVEFTCG